jgi:hypothetical protein
MSGLGTLRRFSAEEVPIAAGLHASRFCLSTAA